MNMHEFVHKLQSALDKSNINFGNAADSVLSFLCSAYYEHNCSDDSNETATPLLHSKPLSPTAVRAVGDNYSDV